MLRLGTRFPGVDTSISVQDPVYTFSIGAAISREM